MSDIPRLVVRQRHEVSKILQPYHEGGHESEGYAFIVTSEQKRRRCGPGGHHVPTRYLRFENGDAKPFSSGETYATRRPTGSTPMVSTSLLRRRKMGESAPLDIDYRQLCRAN